jgi:hypothetical protein
VVQAGIFLIVVKENIYLINKLRKLLFIFKATTNALFFQHIRLSISPQEFKLLDIMTGELKILIVVHC